MAIYICQLSNDVVSIIVGIVFSLCDFHFG